MPDARIPRHYAIHIQEGQDCKINGKFWMKVFYWIWGKVDMERLRSPGLLSRAKLEHWLYAYFLKIILPFPRPHRAMRRLLSHEYHSTDTACRPYA
jgi:hypothetical protein